ncbi:YdcF family protein [Arcanobacterium phocisimile]|uniref:YdcF family protein n=1 Tax=Arcanobacterium phocisimile TaxID=1302235 RepID=A0ABX7II46_9ACTO|nr:YdcF family protein [Arcanobacterium phocisimile]QRV02656.1 YdcF family protein [Arcanobacterium phocisimile]
MNLFVVITLVLAIAGIGIIFWGIYRYMCNPRRRHTGAFFISGVALQWLACCALLIRGGLPSYVESVVLWIACVGGYFGFLLAGFAWLTWRAQRRRSAEGFDAVVILGAGLIGDRVSPLLARRIDRGIELVCASAELPKRPLLLCSGGQGSDEVVSEAQAMENYANAMVKKPLTILKEERSTSTQENLVFSQELLDEHLDSGAPVAVATSNYHVLRTQVLARRLGLNWQIFGAHAPTFLTSVSFLREFVALSLVWWPYVCGPLVFLTGALLILQ